MSKSRNSQLKNTHDQSAHKIFSLVISDADECDQTISGLINHIMKLKMKIW